MTKYRKTMRALGCTAPLLDPYGVYQSFLMRPTRNANQIRFLRALGEWWATQIRRETT